LFATVADDWENYRHLLYVFLNLVEGEVQRTTGWTRDFPLNISFLEIDYIWTWIWWRVSAVELTSSVTSSVTTCVTGSTCTKKGKNKMIFFHERAQKCIPVPTIVL
jgi:hypothetical protein